MNNIHIFNDIILSCFFLYLKVYANDAEHKNDVTKDSPIPIKVFAVKQQI